MHHHSGDYVGCFSSGFSFTDMLHYLSFLDASKMEAFRQLDKQLCTLFREYDISLIVYVI
jgi:hypothetical protein